MRRRPASARRAVKLLRRGLRGRASPPARALRTGRPGEPPACRRPPGAAQGRVEGPPASGQRAHRPASRTRIPGRRKPSRRRVGGSYARVAPAAGKRPQRRRRAPSAVACQRPPKEPRPPTPPRARAALGRRAARPSFPRGQRPLLAWLFYGYVRGSLLSPRKEPRPPIRVPHDDPGSQAARSRCPPRPSPGRGPGWQPGR